MAKICNNLDVLALLYRDLGANKCYGIQHKMFKFEA